MSLNYSLFYTNSLTTLVLRYNTSVLLRLSDLSCWLHSHKDLYPLKYPDGRGSSYQQQVTCYEFKDKNNYWILRKYVCCAWWSMYCTTHFFRPDSPNDTSPVRNKEVMELVHAGTEKLLNSHDVAAPLTPANQEVAGYVNYSNKFVPYLSWRLVSSTVDLDSYSLPLLFSSSCQGSTRHGRWWSCVLVSWWDQAKTITCAGWTVKLLSAANLILLKSPFW